MLFIVQEAKVKIDYLRLKKISRGNCQFVNPWKILNFQQKFYHLPFHPFNNPKKGWRNILLNSFLAIKIHLFSQRQKKCQEFIMRNKKEFARRRKILINNSFLTKSFLLLLFALTNCWWKTMRHKNTSLRVGGDGDRRSTGYVISVDFSSRNQGNLNWKNLQGLSRTYPSQVGKPRKL